MSGYKLRAASCKPGRDMHSYLLDLLLAFSKSLALGSPCSVQLAARSLHFPHPNNILFPYRPSLLVLFFLLIKQDLHFPGQGFGNGKQDLKAKIAQRGIGFARL